MSESKRADWRRAVVEVLGRHEGAMSPAEIVAELQAAGNCPWAGKTPDASAGSRIYVDIKNEGKESLFVRPVSKKALFALSEKGRAYYAAIQSKGSAGQGQELQNGVQPKPDAKNSAEPPKYNELYRPVLEGLADGHQHSLSDICDRVAVICNITSAQRALISENSRNQVFRNRVNWACFYLFRAGVLDRIKRGVYVITPAGQQLRLLSPKVKITNEYLAEHYQDFARFLGRTTEAQTEIPAVLEQAAPTESISEETPHDAMDAAYKRINMVLADEILDTILKKNDPAFFERLVVQLLEAMGYGGAVSSNGKTGDEGIDGIIKEDKLGFNKIYIQAKCWDRDRTVGRPELQRFVGALAGQGADKGAFITTASFTPQAREFVAKQHHAKVVLIDGELLAKLMIENNLGVSTQSTYVIKHLDSDFFNEEA